MKLSCMHENRRKNITKLTVFHEEASIENNADVEYEEEVCVKCEQIVGKYLLAKGNKEEIQYILIKLLQHFED